MDDVAANVTLVECPVRDPDLQLLPIRRGNDELRSAKELVRTGQVFEHAGRCRVVL